MLEAIPSLLENTAHMHKRRFNLLGYGAITLYASCLAIAAAGIYGFNVGTLWNMMRKSELTRAQLRIGRMVTTTKEDPMRCRSVRFNNETAALSQETVADCEVAVEQGRGAFGSFSMFRNGFVNR